MVRPSKKKNKKSNRTAFIAMIACAALFFVILFALVKGRSSPRKGPTRPQGQTASVNLPEQQKKEMYRSLFSLKAMLRGAGGDPQRSYKVLADRYNVSTEVVRRVEAEGRRNGWPGASP